MNTFALLRSIGSILFALLTYALWKQTHETEALIFFAIALCAVVVTLPTLLGAAFRKKPKQDGDEL